MIEALHLKLDDRYVRSTSFSNHQSPKSSLVWRFLQFCHSQRQWITQMCPVLRLALLQRAQPAGISQWSMQTHIHFPTSTGHGWVPGDQYWPCVGCSGDLSCDVSMWAALKTASGTLGVFQTELLFNLVCYGKLWASFPLRDIIF